MANVRTERESVDTLCLQMWQTETALVASDAPRAGVDEVGRGCLAGPVFAAAVILGGKALDWVGIFDSKTVPRRRREQLYRHICERADAVGVGVATVEEIDSLNILHASRLAMGRALEKIVHRCEIALVDGTYSPLFEADTRVHTIPVIGGDATCLSVAAASIVAKVERDRLMAELAALHPEYGFERNAGYGTREHLSALAVHGVTPWHRTSFAPVKQYAQTRLDLT